MGNFTVGRFSQSPRAPVGKRFSLAEDGTLVKEAAPLFFQGEYKALHLPATPAGVEELMGVKEDPLFFLTSGISSHESCPVVTTSNITDKVIARSNACLKHAEKPGLLLLDTDAYPEEDAPDGFAMESVDDVETWLNRVLPDPVLGFTVGSTSSGVETSGGTLLTSNDRWHTGIIVKDASDIPRVIETLFARELIAGRGFIMMGANGVLHVRTAIDRQLRVPCQPIYCGPSLTQGLVRRAHSHQYAGTEPLDTREQIPALTEIEALACAKAEQALKRDFLAKHGTARNIRIEVYVEKLADFEGVTKTAIRERLDRFESGNLSIGPEVSIGDFTVEDVYKYPAEFVGKWFPDVADPTYGDGKMIIRRVPDGVGFVGISFAHGQQRTYRLHCSYEFALAAATEGFEKSEKGYTKANKAHNDKQLSPDWGDWGWALGSKDARAQLTSDVMKATTRLKGTLDTDVAAKDPHLDQLDADVTKDFSRSGDVLEIPELSFDGLELIRVFAKSTNQTAARTYKHLRSLGNMYVMGTGEICAVKRPDPTNRSEAKDLQDAGFHPANGFPHPGLPIDMTPLPVKVLRAELTKTVQYYHETQDGKKLVPPPPAVESDMAHAVKKPLRVLLGVTTVPLLLDDGVLEADGYDVDTCIYACIPDNIRNLVPLDADCDLKAAQASLKWLLDTALAEFKWYQDWAPFAVVNFMLTMVARLTLPGEMPGLMLNANDAGTGKSMLCVMMLILSGEAKLSGVKASGTADKASEEELEKRLCAVAKKGSNALLLNNIPNGTTVSSPTLATLVTEPDGFEVRNLGANTMQLITPVPILANGNNVAPGDDLCRRFMRPTLLKRESGFKFARTDLRAWAWAHRETAMRHLYTLLLYGQQLEDDDPLLCEALGSFEALEGFNKYLRTVAGPVALAYAARTDDKGVVTLDHEKLYTADVCRFRTENDAEDPSAVNRKLATDLLLIVFGSRKFTAGEISRVFFSELRFARGLSGVCAAANVDMENAKRRAASLDVDLEDVNMGHAMLRGLLALDQGDVDAMLAARDPIPPNSTRTGRGLKTLLNRRAGGLLLRPATRGAYFDVLEEDPIWDPGFWIQDAISTERSAVTA